MFSCNDMLLGALFILFSREIEQLNGTIIILCADYIFFSQVNVLFGAKVVMFSY
jgi:hypothetical protein